MPSIVLAASNPQGKYYTRLDIGYGITKVKVNEVVIDAVSTDYKTPINKNGRGFLGSIGLGYHATKDVRVEGQLYFDDGFRAKSTYKDEAGDTQYVRGKERTIAGFINAYYDCHNSSAIAPYVMGGIGLAQNKFKYNDSLLDNSANFKKTNEFAYQLGLGAYYKFAGNYDLDFSYRLMKKGNKKHKYTAIPATGVTDAFTFKQQFNHTFLIGFKYKF